MATVQVAEQRGVPPSEVFGITCPYCAYCFDEALVIRRGVLASAEEEKAEGQAKTDEHRSKLRSVLKEAPGV